MTNNDVVSLYVLCGFLLPNVKCYCPMLSLDRRWSRLDATCLTCVYFEAKRHAALLRPIEQPCLSLYDSRASRPPSVCRKFREENDSGSVRRAFALSIAAAPWFRFIDVPDLSISQTYGYRSQIWIFSLPDSARIA